jgi:hypothetical protein
MKYKSLRDQSQTSVAHTIVPQKAAFRASGFWLVKDLAQNKTCCRFEQFFLLRALICVFHNTCIIVNKINIRSRYKVMIYAF